MKVVIEIALGNEAMQSGFDAAQATQQSLVFERPGKPSNEPLARGEGGSIRDRNGNTVGVWRVER